MKTESNKQNLQALRHSASHVLAQAVLEMFPEAKLGIGPAIEDGFYYDFDLPRTLIPEDLPILEKKMQKIIAANLQIKPEKLPRKKAEEFLKKIKQPYKQELLKEIPDKEVSFYRQGDFVDLCAGPHVDSTGEIKAFKLLTIAGAYWRGSEKNRMLQRIYGTAFHSQKELQDFLKMKEEAEKRDHRKLGARLGLFTFDKTAPGMPYWLPKGVTIFNTLVDFWREEHQKRNYQEIKSPLLNKKELFETSGHWEHYRDEMFVVKTEEKETYALKAMNCPNAMIIYGMTLRSYKELPLRLSDTDILHRSELSGTLNGLFRVRSFAQDDAHIFVTPEQVKEEYGRILELVERFYSVFNLEYSFRLGTRADKFMGEPKDWDRAEKELKEILEESKKEYMVLEGDGAFYGPKIDILMKDSLGREWQMGTIQLDFQMPERFKLSYIDKKGKEKTPVCIHRVIYGSLERFIGILIEHFAGAFPVWLSPVQVRILNVGRAHEKYASQVKEELEKNNIRAEVDFENKTMGKKIRDAELEKIPYVLVVGDKEIKSKSVAVREFKKGDLGPQKLEKFIEDIIKKIRDKL